MTILQILIQDINKLDKKIDETIINQNKYIRNYNKFLERKIKILFILNFIEIITIIYILWR